MSAYVGVVLDKFHCTYSSTAYKRPSVVTQFKTSKCIFP